MADLQKSYEHLCKMRDEIVSLGIIPPVSEWKGLNPNL
jgi:malate dehydrogenase